MLLFSILHQVYVGLHGDEGCTYLQFYDSILYCEIKFNIFAMSVSKSILVKQSTTENQENTMCYTFLKAFPLTTILYAPWNTTAWLNIQASVS